MSAINKLTDDEVDAIAYRMMALGVNYYGGYYRDAIYKMHRQRFPRQYQINGESEEYRREERALRAQKRRGK